MTHRPYPSPWFTLLLAAALLGLAAGCGTLGHKVPPVGEVHLFGLPTALTAPGSSQPAGVGIRIYASAVGGAQGIPIRQGRLEVLLFDQPAEGLDPKTKTPLKVWSLQPADLAPFRSVTLMGTCYTLELRWDQARPTGKIFTVVARYAETGKADIYSTPAMIAATVH